MRHLEVATLALSVAVVAAGGEPGVSADAEAARLRARPAPRLDTEPTGPGVHPLGLGGARDGVVLVPPGVHADRPAPLLVFLHGAGGDGARAARLVEPLAAAVGAIVLAPDSRRATWDVILGGFGPDVAFLDAALARVFETCAVDPARIAIAGFSDGASYALTLALANGELFSAAVAFSPGFALPPARQGTPRLFVSHGEWDRVLPVAMTSRRIVVRLEEQGYEVRYLEFDGGHEVPREIAAQAMAWLGWQVEAPARSP